MIRTGLLLAAGASRRFGADDKLLALRDGRPLVAHAAQALRDAGLSDRVAVIANPALAPWLDGFRIVTVPPGGGQSDSLRAGLAQAGGWDRLLIALGDMPDVTAAHLDRLMARATDRLAACSHDGTAPLPPACFPRASLPALEALRGDRGAGALLGALPPGQHVAAPKLLRDIDRPLDLAPPPGQDVARP